MPKKQPCAGGHWDRDNEGDEACTICNLYRADHPDGDLADAWLKLKSATDKREAKSTRDDRDRVEEILPCECSSDPNHLGPCLASYRIKVLDLIAAVRTELTESRESVE